MARVLALLHDGFEDAEAIVTIDLLKRAKQRVDIISVQNKDTITGKYESILKADKWIKDIKLDSYDALFLPGGPAVVKMLDNDSVLRTINAFCLKEKVVAAICAAPALIGKMACLENQKATCFPGFEKYLFNAKYTGKKVETSGNVITARGVGVVFDFALTFIEKLTDKETKTKIMKETQM